jgi:phosphatidylglycerophosphate synthase
MTRALRAVPAGLANGLTGLRLLLALPVAVLMSRPDPDAATLAGLVLLTAIGTDLLDGRAARAAGTAGPRGQLFDHGTDCLFVTAALAGAAARDALTWLLPVLVVLSFGQYVADSWWLYPGDRPPAVSRGLLFNRLGHYNGVLYFVPPVLDVAARHDLVPDGWAAGLAWLLVITTLLSMLQRARWLGRRSALGSRPAGRLSR